MSGPIGACSTYALMPRGLLRAKPQTHVHNARSRRDSVPQTTICRPPIHALNDGNWYGHRRCVADAHLRSLFLPARCRMLTLRMVRSSRRHGSTRVAMPCYTFSAARSVAAGEMPVFCCHACKRPTAAVAMLQ